MKRVSDTERITAFFMESELAVATTALNTAKAIVASRLKLAGTGGGITAGTTGDVVTSGAVKTRKPRTSKNINGTPDPGATVSAAINTLAAAAEAI
jgi:hypothetical protein